HPVHVMPATSPSYLFLSSLLLLRPLCSPLFPYTTLFRSCFYIIFYSCSYYISNDRHTFFMSSDTRKPFIFSPPTIAIHNNRNMFWSVFEFYSFYFFTFFTKKR